MKGGDLVENGDVECEEIYSHGTKMFIAEDDCEWIFSALRVPFPSAMMKKYQLE